MSTIVEKLLATARTHDAHVRAAVTLLAEHGKWLRNKEFLRFVDEIGTGAYVGWPDVRNAFDRGGFGTASDSERGVLDFAIDLALGRFEFSSLDRTNRNLVLNAVATALGLDTELGGGGKAK